MNFRHATALALVGWYLMTPPPGPDGRLLVNAPLSQWRTTWALDSAIQCKQWLNDFRDDAKADSTKKFDSCTTAKKAGHKLTDSQLLDLDRGFRTAVVSEQIRCIASDDPGLEKK